MKSFELDGRLPAPIAQINQIFNKYGLYLVLVGGSVRDYLLTGNWGKDFDIEVRADRRIELEVYRKIFKSNLMAADRVEKLPFEIFRAYFGDIECEFSPPRIEIFNRDIHHKNFEAQFDFTLDESIAWKRRDFTLNSLGVSCKSPDRLIDPFGGKAHLLARVLYPCDLSFSKDPVRLLRFVRFSLKLQARPDPSLEKLLSQMSLDEKIEIHLGREMKKSQRPAEFIDLLFKTLKKYNLGHPTQWEILKDLPNSGSIEPKQFLVDRVLDCGHSSDTMAWLIDFFQIKGANRHLKSLSILKERPNQSDLEAVIGWYRAFTKLKNAGWDPYLAKNLGLSSYLSEMGFDRPLQGRFDPGSIDDPSQIERARMRLHFQSMKRKA